MERRDQSCAGTILALAVPFVLIVILSAIPVRWAPGLVGYGEWFMAAILLVGTTGVVLQPWPLWLRLLLVICYLPVMYLALGVTGLVSGCLIQGGAACP